MIVAQVIGTVVATRKHNRLQGATIQVIQPLHPQTGKPDGLPLVALDVVGAGVGETVIAAIGSSARLATAQSDTPTDAAIIGIVDQINIESFSGSDAATE